MKTIQLWDQIDYDGHPWQVIAVSDRQCVLRCSDGPGVRLVSPDELLGSATTPRLPPLLSNLDVVSTLAPSDQQRAEVLDHHLHEIEYGLPPNVPPGTRPRPEYDTASTTLTERLRAKASELAAVGTPVSERQMWRHLARWRQSGKAGLVDQRILTPTQLQSRPELVTLIEEHLSGQTNRSTGSVTRAITLVAIQAAEADIALPSRATMFRLMTNLDRHRHTFGNATTRRTQANSPDRTFGHQSPTRPGELTEIDSTPLDLLVMFPDGSSGRVELTALIDIATRTVCGAVLSPVAAKAVDAAVLLAKALTPTAVQPGWADALALARALTPTGMLGAAEDGHPSGIADRPPIMIETVTIDRGKVFLSETFRAACERLEIGITVAAPRTPTDKPHIERIFESINNRFTQYLAGYTGANVIRRGRDVADEAIWPLGILQSVLDVWLAQVWQNLPHDGLRHPAIPQRPLSPNEMYQTLSSVAPAVPVTLDRDDYIALLPREWRSIQRYGINLHGLVYDSPGLDHLRNTVSGLRHPGVKGRWEVHYDPYRMNAIWIRDHRRDTWIEAVWRLSHLTAGPFSLEILDAAKHVLRQPAAQVDPTTLLGEILRIQTGLTTRDTDPATRRLHQRATAAPVVPERAATNRPGLADDDPGPQVGLLPELTVLTGRRYRPVKRVLYDPPTPQTPR